MKEYKERLGPGLVESEGWMEAVEKQKEEMEKEIMAVEV